MDFLSNNEEVKRDQSASTSIFANNNVIVIENEECSFKSNFDDSSPASSTSPYNFDFFYENIDNTFNVSNISDLKITSPYIKCCNLEENNTSNLIKSQVNDSISSQLTRILQSIESADCNDNENRVDDRSPLMMYDNSQRKENNNKNELHPNKDMMQSVITEMLKDMKDIEDYISAYISSFCILEKEFENYAAIKSSSEVVSSFLYKVQSSSTDTPIENAKSDRQCGQYKCCALTEEQRLNFVLDECSQENCENESSNKKASSYYYWEDEAALTSFVIEATTSRIHLDNIITPENSRRNHTSLVPVSFFDNIWKDIMESFDGDDFSQHKCSNGVRLQQYCPLTSMYDPTLLEEDETVVHAVDTFLSRCCNTKQTNRGQNIPCTIIELNDGYDASYITDWESNCAVLNNGTIPTRKISNEQAEWNKTTVLQPNKTTCLIIDKSGIKDSKLYDESVNVSNTQSTIETDHKEKASTPDSNVEITALMDKLSRDINSGYERSFEQPNSVFVKEANRIKNKELKNYDLNNKISKQFKTENLQLKEVQNYKQKQKIVQFPKASSPLNVYKKNVCSSEYRGDLNDNRSVNSSLEESITSELVEKNSNRRRSRFVYVPEDSKGNTTKTNSSYLFSSPNVQLNLTNPLSNEKK